MRLSDNTRSRFGITKEINEILLTEKPDETECLTK